MRIHDAYTKQDRTARAEGPVESREVGGRTKTAGSTGAAAGSAGAAAGSAATTVNVSARARELAANAGTGGARIDALRAHVRAGTFEIDAKSIAQHLVGDLDQ